MDFRGSLPETQVQIYRYKDLLQIWVFPFASLAAGVGLGKRVVYRQSRAGQGQGQRQEYGHVARQSDNLHDQFS